VKCVDGSANENLSDYVINFSIEGNSNLDVEKPTIPTNLQSSSQTQTSISLSWTAATDNIGVEGYKIFQDNVEIITTSDVIYNITNLQENTEYRFEVSAYDSV